MSSGPTRSRARIFGLRASLALFMLVLTPASAHAQTTQVKAGGALDRFDPSPAGDTFFSLPSADVEGRLRFAASAEIDYAHDPLVLRHTSGGTPLAWVSSQAVLHAQLSVEVWKRIKLDLEVPILVGEGGTSGSIGEFAVTSPTGAHVGDVRVGARGVILHQHGLVPAAAITFDVWAPSGSQTAFAGAGVYRYQPGLVLGADYRHLVWGASVGTRFQPETTTGVSGSQLTGGLGVAARVVGLTVGPELFYGASLGDPRNPIVSASSGSNAELLVAARYRLGPIAFGLAGGPGLGRGPGTPTYRLLAGISGAFDALSPDEDETAAETSTAVSPPVPPPGPTHAEPPPDRDGDGVPDAEDACPDLVGDATPGAYRRGCPPDRDHDGIFDVDDACPDVPGAPSTDPKLNGCPLDSDGDGIPDSEDACPHDQGPRSADPKLNGCPSSVRVEGEQIVILQQVNFETGKDTITKESFGILEQVAGVLRDRPDIARLAVDGHTDNRGGDKPNKNLSERRALAVVRWLIDHGVDARRLEARGFGQRRPIAANLTNAGRAQNRRVEFLIRRRTPLGKDGWFDGPVDDGTPAPPPAAPAPP
jgi:OmpA-OmpF porin, OOP family